LSDTSEQNAEQDDELVGLDGSPNWAKARELIRRQQAEVGELRMMLDREHDERRQIEVERARDAETIGDLRAELAFTQSGIDTTGGAGALFARIYDGPLEVDAMQASYAQYLSDARTAAAEFAAHLRTTPNGEASARDH
jgi:TolA-binding protein